MTAFPASPDTPSAVTPDPCPECGTLCATCDAANDPHPKAVAILVTLDLDAVLDHKRRLSAQRNTLSRSIAALDQVIALMEANPRLRTVGDALPVLMAVAS